MSYKIIIDFAKKKTLGNVYDPKYSDNLKSFNEAEILYSKNKQQMDDNLNNLNLAGAQIGATIVAPTTSFTDRGFISAMTFSIEKRENGICWLTLESVNT